MERISRTLDLAKDSWALLKADRELLWLPVLSALFSIGAAVAFFLPAALMVDTTTSEFGTETTSVSPMTALLFVAGSILIAIITVFFQGALVHGAHTRITGGDPTVSSSMSGAWSKLHRLIPWALLNWTVGAILNAVRERSGFLGDLAASIVGYAWNLVTFLAVPVLIIEDKGAIEGVKRSGSLFKRTWGENVAAQFGFGLLGFIAIIPAVLIVAMGFSFSTAAGFLALALAIVYAAAVAVVMTALNAVFQTALYHYAVSGETVPQFSSDLPRAFGAR